MKRVVYFSVLMVLIVGTFATAEARAQGNGMFAVPQATEAGTDALTLVPAAHSAAVDAFGTGNAEFLPRNGGILKRCCPWDPHCKKPGGPWCGL